MAQWNGRDKVPSRLELQAQLPKLKREKPELTKVYSTADSPLPAILQLTLSQPTNKGKRVGRLRFKGKGWYKTFTYNQSGFELIRTGWRLDLLHLSKIGDIPIRVHRVEGKIKQITIKKQNSKWFACICAEREISVKKSEHKRVVGIDVGVRHFLA